jgi:hypothetical protein
MDILISILRGSETVPHRLRRDGWHLAAATDHSFVAHHPGVTDEPEARIRLQKLGLLTSRALRIEFPVSAAGQNRISGAVERN